MFNLPFPTDSLYKFCFMFGLVLIVFSVYYRDKQINRYYSKSSYHALDSLKEDTATANLVYRTDSLQMAADSIDLIKENDTVRIRAVARSWSNLRETVGNAELVKKAFDNILVDSLKNVSAGANKSSFHRKLDFLWALTINYDTDYVKEKKENIDFYNSKVFWEGFYFIALLTSGLLLFFLGLYFWFIKIQKPQDLLLKIQLAEAQRNFEKTTTVIPTVTSRKHFEPKVLPRPEARNLR